MRSISNTEEWGLYQADPPATDLWYFREHEVELLAHALAQYVAEQPCASQEREHAMIIWRRLSGKYGLGQL